MKEAQLFTKKPVTISAIKWNGDNLAYVIYFTDGRMPLMGGDHAGMKWEEYEDLVERDGLKIFTLEGKMKADIGDYIIKGVKGEFYPCKPDIFAMTYDRAALQAQAAPATLPDDVMESLRWLRTLCAEGMYKDRLGALNDWITKYPLAHPAAPDTQAAGPVAWTNASWLSNPHAGHFRADRTASFNVPLYTSPPSHEAALLAAREALKLFKSAGYGNSTDYLRQHEAFNLAADAIAQIDRALGRAGT